MRPFNRGPRRLSAIGHGSFPVKVTKTIDSSKLKAGDVFELETAGAFKLRDGTLVPKGSKMTGHIVAAQARAERDQESQLTMTFDKLALGNGKVFTVRGMVQAVFPPAEEQPDPNMAGAASMAAGGGGFEGTVTNAKNGSNTDADTHTQPVMTPSSVGVQGMHDLQLDNGVLRSKGKSVKLGKGVRMIVRAEILA